MQWPKSSKTWVPGRKDSRGLGRAQPLRPGGLACCWLLRRVCTGSSTSGRQTRLLWPLLPFGVRAQERGGEVTGCGAEEGTAGLTWSKSWCCARYPTSLGWPTGGERRRHRKPVRGGDPLRAAPAWLALGATCPRCHRPATCARAEDARRWRKLRAALAAPQRHALSSQRPCEVGVGDLTDQTSGPRGPEMFRHQPRLHSQQRPGLNPKPPSCPLLRPLCPGNQASSQQREATQGLPAGLPPTTRGGMAARCMSGPRPPFPGLQVTELSRGGSRGGVRKQERHLSTDRRLRVQEGERGG